jgi:hypothetical protein
MYKKNRWAVMIIWAGYLIGKLNADHRTWPIDLVGGQQSQTLQQNAIAAYIRCIDQLNRYGACYQ